MSREKVYAMLCAQPGEFFSGQELSRRLGISRAAIWKAVDGLRQDGYVIEARMGLGYRLVSAPDALVEREIRRYLAPGTVCPDLRCLEEIDSTNSYLKREALAGAVSGTVAVNYGTLNLRSYPSSTGTVLANMPGGATVTVYGEWQGWYVVHYGDYVGYAAAAYIDIP